MTPHPHDYDLTSLAFGLIDGGERDEMLEHLEDCPDCFAIYQSALDEQSLVREALFEDSRQGAAEARALENTLQALNDPETPKPRGRVFTLRRVALVAQIAAMVVLAVALLWLWNPTDEAPDDTVRVAENRIAPVEVVSGAPLVSNASDEWKPADRLPLDEWVMADDSAPFVIRFKDGSQAKLATGSVFQLTFIGSRDGEPVIQMLSGDGEIDARQLVRVLSGDTDFIALPGSNVRLTANQGRNFSERENAEVVANVSDGGVLFRTVGRPNPQALVTGDKLRWTPKGVALYSKDNPEMEIFLHGPNADRANLFRMERVLKVLPKPDSKPSAAYEIEIEALRSEIERMRDRMNIKDKQHMVAPPPPRLPVAREVDLVIRKTEDGSWMAVWHVDGKRNTATAATQTELVKQLPDEYRDLNLGD